MVKCEEKGYAVGGLSFFGCVVLSLGLGMLYGQLIVGLLIGIGLGFLIMALSIGFIKK